MPCDMKHCQQVSHDGPAGRCKAQHNSPYHYRSQKERLRWPRLDSIRNPSCVNQLSKPLTRGVHHAEIKKLCDGIETPGIEQEQTMQSGEMVQITR